MAVNNPLIIFFGLAYAWAWIVLALLLARELKRRGSEMPLAGLVLIAPAVDFTEALMWRNFPAEVKRELETKGMWVRLSQYDDKGYPITRRLIEDGRAHLLLGGMIETGCPVRILQGVLDPDVPWGHANFEILSGERCRPFILYVCDVARTARGKRG